MSDAKLPKTKQDALNNQTDAESPEPLATTRGCAEHELAETIAPQEGNAVESASDVARDHIKYFGDYELLEEIASGGMGVVYKARQSRLKRIVAVKMILGGKLASDKDVKRFLVEAEAAANLDHPGIVPVYEFGEHGGMQYFSMAFVDGPSLAELSGENPLPQSSAADLLVRVTEAVAYAHQRGVVHRDLKPANVLIEPGGQPRITDFGLAKRIDTDDELTQDGAIIGSVLYMPPEQAAGKSALIGPAADIYSLGAILYKLLTGHPPFQAPTTMELLRQVVEQEPVPPRRLNQQISRDLETICLKCLQKDISRRFDSADELVAELKRFQQGEPILSRPIGRWAYAWRWCRRNPLAVGLIAVLLTAVVTATSFLNWAQSEQRRYHQQQRTVSVLSNMVLSKTLDETDDWLRSFFAPVERELHLVHDWYRDGILNAEEADEVNRQLVPLIKHCPQVSSVMIADDRGREHMLLCITEEQDGRVRRQWISRQTRRDQWQSQVKLLEWKDDQAVDTSVRTDKLEYDPRTRPWFRRAIEKHNSPPAASGTADSIHWTEPYVFFTAKALGITASLKVDGGQFSEFNSVVAFDVLLEDITRFTTRKQPTGNGRVFVLTGEGLLVGLPHDPNWQSPEQWKQLFLKHLSDLDQSIARDAAQAFSFSVAEGSQIRSFQSDDSIWWGAAKPFQLGTDLTFWILVLLPESDLRQSIAEAE